MIIELVSGYPCWEGVEPSEPIRKVSVELLLLFAGFAHATVLHVPIRSGGVLETGEAYTAGVNSAKAVEVGWTAVQAKSCTTNWVEATEMGETSRFAFAAALDGSKIYEPIQGRVGEQRRCLRDAGTQDAVKSWAGSGQRLLVSTWVDLNAAVDWLAKLKIASQSTADTTFARVSGLT